MSKYTIEYGWGIATLFTPSSEWEERFYYLAEQCYGIRKSIDYAHLLRVDEEEPAQMIPGEYERLEHHGDVIVWNEAGEKIKSEWDF